MKNTDNRHAGTHARSEIDLVRGSAHHAGHSLSPRRPFDYWSVCLGLLCVAIGLPAFFVSAQDTASADKASPEKAAPAAAAAKPAAAPVAGTTIYREDKVRLTFVEKRDLTFDRAGVLEFVHEDGETVEAGKVVARFLSAREQAGLLVAQARVLNQAEILEAKAQADLAQLKLTSSLKANEKHKAKKEAEAEQLKKDGKVVPEGFFEPSFNSATIGELQKSLEAAMAAVGRAEKEHAVNEKGVEQAQADLTLTEIKAPMAGQVTRVYKRSGEGVQASEKVLQIISTQRIRATVEVPVAIAARMTKGMPVTVIVDQPDEGNTMKTQRYTVPLRSIDPSVIPGAQKVTIWAEIDNTDGKLREGLTSSLEVTFSN